VKLLTKLTFFIALSKLAIVTLFVMLLPYLVERIASEYTNYYLKQQKQKVLQVTKSKGIDFYLQGDESYGSYTMLKEEYIALEQTYYPLQRDTIETAKRVVERDTLSYRILKHNFKVDNKNYLLEIGKTTNSINQYNHSLQRIALFVLMTLIALTIVVDLVFTRIFLKPLGLIIKHKLVDQKFPFSKHLVPIKTSTYDFKYLDSAIGNLMLQINLAFEKEREFTANASHELLTPISILQTKIENMMIDVGLAETNHQQLAEMMRTVHRLKKIVNSLMLISRIENKQFDKKDDVFLGGLIAEVMEELEHRLAEKSLKFMIQLKYQDCLKKLNHDLLFQLFYNLINNAIRYNKPNGEIIIFDSILEGSYAVSIKDTGYGISDADLPHIFNRFKRVNKIETAGYGLGLAIVKSIADYHYLKLRVNSEENIGTTFTVIFKKGHQA
jgi:two-component system sensor histidine kinase ArlS